VALIDRENSWTYAEVRELVARAIGTLRSHDVVQGSVILFIAPVDARAVVAYLAALRLGAVVVMLDRKCGASDVEHVTERVDIDFVISDHAGAARLDIAALGRPVIALEDLGAGSVADEDWPEPNLDAPAVVFATSGTTSRPKMVIHSINTIRSGARNMATATRLDSNDMLFLSSPLASITGVLQVHLALERGAGLALEDNFNPADSLKVVIDLGITVIGGATVILDILFRQADKEGISELPLRVMSLGGGAIPRDLVEIGQNRWGITPVRVYGSSEAPLATHTLPDDQGELRLTDDGGLADGTEIKLDESVGGEILVRGPMLFLGYVHDEDNSEAFTDGWYRTGDLGRVEDGRLWVTGRLKEIVARKGLKISLNEIDVVARKLPGIEEAVTYGVPDPETGERLALALYSESALDITFESVIEWFRSAGLATFKLPEEIVIWEGPLPRTASGKVQRRELQHGGVRRLLAPRLRDQAPTRQ
jgi:acyl-CoA synthetase (AMP-forming)/AMP-acid ligase II